MTEVEIETPEGKVELNETQEQMITISQGNPGALSVLIQLYQLGANEIIGWIHGKEELWGPNLWILYKDENGEDIIGTAAELVGMMLDDGALVL